MTCDLRITVVGKNGVRTEKIIKCSGKLNECLRKEIFESGAKKAVTNAGETWVSGDQTLVEGSCKKDNC